MYVDSRKEVKDDLIFKGDVETQAQRMNIWTPKGKGGWEELGDGDGHIHY